MTDQTISDILRSEIKRIKENAPVFSYADLKRLAYAESIEEGTIYLSLYTLLKHLNDKIK